MSILLDGCRIVLCQKKHNDEISSEGIHCCALSRFFC
jgi:hypothetical protein